MIFSNTKIFHNKVVIGYIVSIIYLFTGCEDESKFIVSQDINYFTKKTVFVSDADFIDDKQTSYQTLNLFEFNVTTRITSDVFRVSRGRKSYAAGEYFR